MNRRPLRVQLLLSPNNTNHRRPISHSAPPSQQSTNHDPIIFKTATKRRCLAPNTCKRDTLKPHLTQRDALRLGTRGLDHVKEPQPWSLSRGASLNNVLQSQAINSPSCYRPVLFVVSPSRCALQTRRVIPSPTWHNQTAYVLASSLERRITVRSCKRVRWQIRCNSAARELLRRGQKCLFPKMRLLVRYASPSTSLAFFLANTAKSSYQELATCSA
jgi:hypothetical protein